MVAAIEVGRICVKLAGREVGKKCVIIDIIDKNFVLITGPEEVSGVRRRRSNIDHIEPLKDKIEITRGATDEEVTQVLEDSEKLEYMRQSIQPTLSPA